MPNENFITRAARTISHGHGHFRAPSGVHRPLLTRPEFYATVIPLTLLTTSCMPPGGAESTPGPTVIETPKPLSQLVAEQIKAGDPLAGYSSTASRRDDAFIKEQEAQHGKLDFSQVIVGIDANNQPVMSEIFNFENGSYVVFYDKDGKAVSDMSEIKINYGYDTSDNLVLNFKADIDNGDGKTTAKQFLTFTSQTTLDQLGPDVIRKLQEGDEAINKQLLGNFEPDQLIYIDYINPQTKQSVTWKNTSPNWGKIKRFISGLNPLYASPVHAAPAEPTVEATATIPATPSVKTETIEGKSYTVTGYEARDNSGALQYIKDTTGKWIKAPPEVDVPVDTGLATRLGTDFALTADGTGITGVDGLTIDRKNGTATFNFDGKGEETFSTSDIHVVTKDINGQPMEPTLLMAGYAWNPEAGKWEIYNPGFPMDTAPKDSLGWFNQNDIANGNWLRWHQRVLEDLAKQNGFKNAEEYLKELFKNAMVPDNWYAQETLIDDRDLNNDGTKDVLHLRKLVWTSGEYNSSLPVSQKEIIKKDQFPWRGGLSFSFLADSDCVLISFDVQNGDKSKTSVPTVLDSVLWTNFSDSNGFERAALASGHETKRSSDTESWVFGLVINNLPDATMTNSMGESDVAITKEPVAAQRREETIVGSKVSSAAGLEIWGSIVLNNYHE